MADSYLWFEHTEQVVQDAFQAASEYYQKARQRFKAYQAPQNVVLNVNASGQRATYKVPRDYWLVYAVGSGEISVYSPTDFQNLYELVT